MSQLTKALKCCAAFYPDFCILQDLFTVKEKEIGKKEGELYVLHTQRRLNNPAKSFAVVRADIELWHKRLGHVPFSVIKKLPNLTSSDSTRISHCEVCPLPRQARILFPISTTRAVDYFDLLHMDVCGPYKALTHNGKRFFLIIIDDCSRWTWIFLLHLKSDVVAVLKHFIIMVRTQFGKMIKCFRSDNGIEFFNQSCNKLFSVHVIVHQSSCPCTPQQNGVVEIRHRHILETARAIRFQGYLPIQF